jgi:peroxiredoxin
MAEGSIEILARGDRAPNFELKGTDEERYTLDDFADNDALLVVFTCNHCPYAKAKIPVLNDLADDYDDVAVVGINSNDEEEYPDDSFERMQEVVGEGHVRYDAYLRDETQEVAKVYGAVCTPDPFLLRKDGDEWVVAYHGRLDDATNPDDDPTRREMREAIDAVLAGEDVDLGFNPSRGCTIKWREGNEPDYWDQI